MASKSKRRGRVFRASCILAALIIAGSSFAWFTSKDEVTNRLTATSDYGVSIVESFVPPANWLPGQAINKDVYAVNTGNVAAFVNEDISGVLNYTYEQKTKDLSDKCVILNDVENGAVTYEAGGFLAWTDAKVTVPKYTIGDKEYEKATVVGITASSDGAGTGEKVFTIKYSAAGQPDYYATADEPTVLYTLSDTNTTDEVPFDTYTAAGAGTTVTEGRKKSNDTVDLGAVNVLIGEENGWKPTEEGAYIFRRAIKNDINPSASETYTYSGFYFVPAGTEVSGEALEEDTYYKIIIGNDTYSTTVADADHDGIADIVFDIYADQAEVQTLGATINEDGTINGKVDYNFVEVQSTGSQPATLVMDAPHNRLIAVYSKPAAGGVDSSGRPYDASAVAARAEVDYENAKLLSDLADQLYGYAQADVAYATKLAEERNKLIQAAIDTYNQHQDLAEALTNRTNAWTDVTEALSAFNTAYQTFTTNGSPDKLSTLDPETFVPENVRNAANANSGADHPQVHNNYEGLKTLYTNMTTAKDNIDGAISVLNGLADGEAPATVQAQLDIIKANLDLLNNPTTGYLKQYQDKYADIVNSVQSDTNLNIGTVELDDQKNRVIAVSGLCTTAKGKFDDLQIAEDGYADAYNTWYDENEDTSTQDRNWAQALTDYNNNVDNAKSKYDDAIGDQDDNSNDHAVAIVAKGAGGDAVGYSLTNSTTANNKDPKIDLDVVDPDPNSYLTYKDFAKVNVENIPDNLTISYSYTKAKDDATVATNPAAPDYYEQETVTTVDTAAYKLSDWETFKNDSNTALAEADQAYADAVSALQGTSDIMIYINLANDAATETSPAYKWSDSWTFDESTNNSTTAGFYYNKILEPGATTEKLVDSVELAGSVKATDYKDLTFDLNVAMDSAQVTYEDDQKTYTAKAVQQDAFRMKVASIENNEDVTWVNYDATAMETQYNLSGITDPVTLEKVSWLKDAVTYNWVAKVDDDYYVGTSRANGSTFKKATVTTDVDGKPNGIGTIADESNNRTLTVSRVASTTP